MKIIKLLMLMVIVSVTVACKKDEADKIDTKKVGREAILGSYNVVNNYEISTWNSDEQEYEIKKYSKNYIITIDKPSRDNFGDRIVVIKNLLINNSTVNIYAKLSPSGDVLDLFNDEGLEENYQEIIRSFQGVIDGNKIVFNYEDLVLVQNEKGTVTATKR